MHLTKVEVSNFRAFEHAVFELPERGITLVVGANNAGKSALLTAADRVNRPETAAAEDIRDGHDLARISADWALDEQDRSELLREYGVGEPRHSEWLASGVFRTMRFGFSLPASNPARWILVELLASDGAGRVEPLSVGPSGGQVELTDLQRWLADEHVSTRFTRRQVRPSGLQHDFDTNYAGVLPLARLLGRWRSGFYHFTARRVGTERRRNINATKDLAPDGSNLAEALLWVRTQREHAEWRLLRQAVVDLLPHAGELETPVQSTQVSVAFRDDDGRLRNLLDLGSGVEQLLLLLFVGVCRPDTSTVIVEEPERDLHPEAQRRLLRHIEGWATERQFVLSTHSTVFLDRADATASGVWVVRRQGGESDVTRASVEGAEALEVLGVRLGDVLSAERVLLVEGPSDRDAFEWWFGERLNSSHAVVVSMGGGDRAWDVDDLDQWVRQANRLPQQVLCIRDRDEYDDTAVRHLEKGPVRVLQRRELENYLTEPAGIRGVLELDEQEWNDSRIWSELRAVADELRDQVVVRRVIERVRGIRLIDRKTAIDVRTARDPRRALSGLVEASQSRLAQLDDWWTQEEAATDSAWETRWLELVPGEELLAGFWSRRGQSFSKDVTSGQLARWMPPPHEIEELLAQFWT